MTFAAELARHGDRPAVITAAGTTSYRQLSTQVDALARHLGPAKRLVLVETADDLPSLVAYLAALRGGHVAILAPRAAPEQITELIDLWDPDVLVTADGVRERRSGSRHALHPELALLLATSGSTGRPRLVRLSADALEANAAAIGEYLGIRPDDRAVASLPIHYCYGLSVVNSNLRAGAALILEGRSVTDPGFWATVREHRATSLHGVPHSFELLDRVGFADMDLPDLRYVTQAGGRLAPDHVRWWAQVGQRRGWELYVMYGQTEATARMAYLPPRLAATHPDTVGVAIPGGTLSIESPGDDGVGEIVFRGPNVMLGYAETPADLALGRTVHALRTGDLGRRRPDGLVEIRGRRSRFVKPFGVRVDLDRLEAHLAGHGLVTAATGTDDRLTVAVEITPVRPTTAPDTATGDTATGDTATGDTATGDTAAIRAVRTVLEQRLRLPTSAAAVVAVAALPRRPNGKIDHAAVARLTDTTAAGDPGGPDGRLGAVGAPSTDRRPWLSRGVLGQRLVRLADRSRPRQLTVREVFARTFPGRPLRDDATFIDLGGDSLTYVHVSAELERALGHLPQRWDSTPLGELAAQERHPGPDRDAGADPVRSDQRRWWLRRAQIEAVVMLRAAAIVLVVGEHTHLWNLLGGAHVLLAVSGWTFARFVLAGHPRPASPEPADGADRESERPVVAGWLLPRRIVRSAAMIAIPTALWIVFRAATQADVHYSDALLMGSVFEPLAQGYWYAAALVQILLVMAALFALPVIRDLDRRYPFGLPFVALGPAELLRWLPERSHLVIPDLYSTHLVAWLFVLGWVIHRARTPAQQWITALVTVVSAASFFGTELVHAAIVCGGLLVLLTVDRVTLPRAVTTPISIVAAASLGIYLTHFTLLPLQNHGVHPAVLLPSGLVLGVASWWFATTIVRRAVTELRVRRLASGHRTVRPAPIAPVSAPEPPADRRPPAATPSICPTRAPSAPC